jgi:hypothetical protein
MLSWNDAWTAAASNTMAKDAIMSALPMFMFILLAHFTISVVLGSKNVSKRYCFFIKHMLIYTY